MLRHRLILVFFVAALTPLNAQAGTKDAKLFLGTWCGQWDGGPQNRLTVERVTGGGIAYGTYTSGTSPNDRRVEYTGKITDGVLKIEFVSVKQKVSYQITDNDTLIGRLKRGFKASVMTSKRC